MREGVRLDGGDIESGLGFCFMFTRYPKYIDGASPFIEL